MKPLYTHDCARCIFLGTWVKEDEGLPDQTVDLYVCPPRPGSLLQGTNCVARWGNEGPDYSSMTLENPLWRSSLAHINGPRQSLYECYTPALCEAWRRWAEHEGLNALPNFPGPHIEAAIKSWHDPQNGANNAIEALALDPAKWKEHVEAEIEKWQHRPLTDVVHDEVRFGIPIQGMESDEVRKAIHDLRKLAKNTPFWPTVRTPGTATGRMRSFDPEMQFFPPQGEKNKSPPSRPMGIDYREMELRILTADGYTLTEKPDGSIGDGDLSWPSMQAFLDSRDGSAPKGALERVAATEMSEDEILAKVREARAKIDERIMRIDTVRRALLAAARVSREESASMDIKEVAEQVLNGLMEGEFDV